jgi:hypothetical protein
MTLRKTRAHILTTDTPKPPLFYYLRRIFLAVGLSAVAHVLWFNELITFSIFLVTSLCFDWVIFTLLGRKESLLISESDLLKLSGSTPENLDIYAAFSVSTRRRSAPWALGIGWAFYSLIPQPHVAGLLLMFTYLVILIPQLLYLKLQLKVKFPYPVSKEPYKYPFPSLSEFDSVNFIRPGSPFYHKSPFE